MRDEIAVILDACRRTRHEARNARLAAILTRVRTAEVCGRHSISGASDDGTQRILAVLAASTLCAECIVRKADVVAARIDDVLVRIGHTVKASTVIGPCDGCGKTTVVYRLG